MFRGKDLSDAEKATIAARYNDHADSGTLRTLAAEMGRPRDTLLKYAHKIGLTKRSRPHEYNASIKRNPKRKATNEELVAAYKETPNVWRVADKFGMCGQSVHERLVKIGVKLRNQGFTNADRLILLDKYENYVSTGRLGILALEMGRTKSSICREAGLFGLTRMDRPCTEGEKAKMSIAATERWRRKTESQRNEWVMKRMLTQALRGNLNPPISTRWSSGWREFGGKRCYFRSAWEANYGRYLEWLKQRGEIVEWEHEPETFWFHKIKRGTRTYLPDFRITNRGGAVVYHEVKGWMDDRSKTKLARMERYYPDVKIVLIDKRQYRILNSQLSRLIQGWESGPRKSPTEIERLIPPPKIAVAPKSDAPWWKINR